MFDIYLTNNSVLRSHSIMMRLEPASKRVVTPLCNQCLFATSLCNLLFTAYHNSWLCLSHSRDYFQSPISTH